MLSSSTLPPPLVPEPHLYDLVATCDGLRLSPTCEDGHKLVMELVERLGLASALHERHGPKSARGDWNGTVFPILQAGKWSRTDTMAEMALNANCASLPEAGAPSEPVPNTVLISASPPIKQVEAKAGTDATAPVTNAELGGKLLSEMTALNLANLSRGPKKATPATRDRRYVLALMMDVLGDKPVADITAEDANAVADVLASWPRYLAHYPELKGLPARTIAKTAKKKKLPTIQRSTQGKHLMALNAFFNWCVETGNAQENPFHYVDNGRYRDAVPKKRDIFSAQDLQEIFAPKHLKRHSEPHKYWAPLIALFTGMRVNEVAQLYLDDLQTDAEVDDEGHEHAILYFDISPFREGQSVKTGYSVRRVPVPQQLLELGFERYLADVRASGSDRLFPGLPWHEEGGPGRAISRWFNKHHLRGACRIVSEKKSLHCFRHTLTTRCERAHVPKSIIQTINGHSDGQGVDSRSYVARGSLLECRRTLDRLDYPPLELVPYASERFAPYLAQVAAQASHAERLGKEGKTVVSRRGRRPTVQISAAHVTPNA